MKELFFWLICNTSIDNGKQTNTREVSKAFLNDYPELQIGNSLFGLIGRFLNYIYHTDLMKVKTDNGVYYNLKIHDKPVKEVIIRDLEY